jgi:hypothetical protein
MATQTQTREYNPIPAVALADMPETSLELKTPEDLVNECAAITDMVGELTKEQKMIKEIIKTWFTRTPGVKEEKMVGHHKVIINWQQKHGENAWSMEELLAFLTGKGLTEAITYRPTVDPVALSRLIQEKRITREELEPFAKPPTEVLNIK